MIIITIIFILAVYSLPSWSGKLSPVVYTWTSVLGLLYSGALSLNALHIQSIGSGVGVLHGNFNASVTSLLLGAFVLFIVVLVFNQWPLVSKTLPVQYDSISEPLISKSKDYILISLFSTLGSLLLLSSTSVMTMFLAVELQSFGVYVLASMYNDSESATSAGLKYFLLGALSSCFILLSIGFVYSFSGLFMFDGLFSLCTTSWTPTVMMAANISVSLLSLGMLFKVAAAPMHYWAPDVYAGTPTVVTIWLTILPKIAILLLLLEVYRGLALDGLDGSTSITLILLVSAGLSMAIGSLMGLSQVNIKRLLAYSTISHVGFMLLALSINTDLATNALLFYLLQYSVTNLIVFLVLIHLSYTNNNQKKLNYSTGNGIDLTFITELRSMMINDRWLALCFVVCLFSMAGMPPLTGFFAKQSVLLAASDAGYYFLSIIAILSSVISASYYLKLILEVHTPNSNINTKSNIISNDSKNVLIGEKINSRQSIYVVSNSHVFVISSLTVAISSFVFNPTLVLNPTHLMSLSLY